jgi:serine/threonine protein phosphatase PrpC
VKYPDRNRLLRAFGVTDNFRAEISEARHLSKGDHWFLLCSDGFWEYVMENEMSAALAKSKNLDAWLKHMLKIHKSRRSKNCDNYSAVLVKIIVS